MVQLGWPTSLVAHKATILRFTAVFVGMLCSASGSFFLLFMSYSNAFKKTFGFTQTQTEVNMAMAYIGGNMCFVAGYFMKRWGPSQALAVGSIGAGASYFLLWGSVHHSVWYRTVPALVFIYNFVAGLTASFAYITALSVCYQNFDPRHKGKVNSLVDTGAGAGLFALSTLYQTSFVKGHHIDEENQNLSGFFMMLAILSVLIGIAGYFFVRIYSPDDAEEHTGPKKDETENEALDDTVLAAGLALLKKVSFQQFAWGFMISTATNMTFILNLGTYTKSLNLEYYIVPLTIAINSTPIFSRLLSGFLSDWLLKRFSLPRSLQVMVWAGLQTIALLLCIFRGENAIVFFMASILIAGSNGCNLGLGASLTTEYVNEIHFAVTYGCILFGTAPLAVTEFIAIGGFYRLAISNPETSTDCYGLHCFTWSLVMMVILSFISFVLFALTFRRDYSLLKRKGDVGGTNDRSYIRLE